MRSLLRNISIALLGVLVMTAAGGFAKPPAGKPPAVGKAPSVDRPTWSVSDTGVTARFRGLAPVNAKVAWVAGAGGTILRTVDGGRSWRSVGPAAAAELQFRDIEAFDRDHAVALTIGVGDQSRVYATSNGGRSWTETYRNDEPTAFYDCLTFLDRRHGLALSDPVGGTFRILATADGGRSWRVRPTAGMPAALTGEFAFAASGTCLVSAPHSNGRAWFATGGAERARVFSTVDGGRSWHVTDSAIPSGPSAGIYSLAFRDPWHGIAVGGDFNTPTVAPNAAAVSRDGGRGWTTGTVTPGEYRSGAAWAGGNTALAVGPTGSDLSFDGGRSWKRFDTGSFDAVACAPHGACWASGEQGRVAVLHWAR